MLFLLSIHSDQKNYNQTELDICWLNDYLDLANFAWYCFFASKELKESMKLAEVFLTFQFW